MLASRSLRREILKKISPAQRGRSRWQFGNSRARWQIRCRSRWQGRWHSRWHDKTSPTRQQFVMKGKAVFLWNEGLTRAPWTQDQSGMWLRIYSSTKGWIIVFFGLTLPGATIAIVSSASNQQSSLLLMLYTVKIRLLSSWGCSSSWIAPTIFRACSYGRYVGCWSDIGVSANSGMFLGRQGTNWWIYYAGLTTAPERMQRVHTRAWILLPPLVAILTRCKFGSQRRLVLLWAWLTLLPVTGPLPHISHFFAMVQLLIW